ncbi:hypothetical protein RHGRI_031711 [Rhododendron griersonianum]|uniref:Riboflavin biosynthesis protein PYRD, chloroplastic n=1 Tax=Rhododendron griersonianum TaxID=479676 RepID=A0AAV6I9B5_9ERIC|nr:hypothetical protein RHGRI_031711 [Rhododendron griersonianum]
MYLQIPSVSRFSLGPSNSKLVPFPISRSGLSISTKRVCKSVTSGRRHGGSVGIRCQGKDDGFYMRRCVEIARKGIGCTSPNPMVGCVVVKDGKIVGEGFHPKAGQPHAEVFALRDAGDLAENSTAYVSLEPCNHYGRTPPCTEALIKAKVKKVVVGMVDPNPMVASKGVDRLRDAGIDVTVGVEEELYSLSIDGHFSDQLGEEVTKPGGYYSQLLQEYDAVIRSSTLLRENFSLPVSEEPGANQPLQIILARNPSSPIQVPVMTTEASSKVVIFTDKVTTVEPETSQKGIETVVLDGMNLLTILEYCKQRGLCSVLLDIRGNIGDFEEMLREGFEGKLLQKVVVEMLPIWKGSKEERFPVAFTSLGQRLRLRNLSSRNSCRSVLLEGYF